MVLFFNIVNSERFMEYIKADTTQPDSIKNEIRAVDRCTFMYERNSNTYNVYEAAYKTRVSRSRSSYFFYLKYFHLFFSHIQYIAYTTPKVTAIQ